MQDNDAIQEMGIMDQSRGFAVLLAESEDRWLETDLLIMFMHTHVALMASMVPMDVLEELTKIHGHPNGTARLWCETFDNIEWLEPMKAKFAKVAPMREIREVVLTIMCSTLFKDMDSRAVFAKFDEDVIDKSRKTIWRSWDDERKALHCDAVDLTFMNLEEANDMVRRQREEMMDDDED